MKSLLQIILNGGPDKQLETLVHRCDLLKKKYSAFVKRFLNPV